LKINAMHRSTPESRRRLGLIVLLVGYVAHFCASLLLPKLALISIVCWFAALLGGAVFCAETLKRLRRTT
jgi:hypothetical protein